MWGRPTIAWDIDYPWNYSVGSCGNFEDKRRYHPSQWNRPTAAQFSLINPTGIPVWVERVEEAVVEGEGTEEGSDVDPEAFLNCNRSACLVIFGSKAFGSCPSAHLDRIEVASDNLALVAGFERVGNSKSFSASPDNYIDCKVVDVLV